MTVGHKDYFFYSRSQIFYRHLLESRPLMYNFNDFVTPFSSIFGSCSPTYNKTIKHVGTKIELNDDLCGITSSCK